VVQQQQRAIVALTSCDDEITAVYCNETPLKQGTAKVWIWTFVAATFTLSKISLTRAAVAPIAVLGRTFPGAVITDRYAGFNAFNGRRQVCWPPLKQNFPSLIDARGHGEIIGNRRMLSLKETFRLWHLSWAGRIRHDTRRK
jgi:transposase